METHFQMRARDHLEMVDDFPDLICLQKARLSCSLSETVYVCLLALAGQQLLSLKTGSPAMWVKQVWITLMLKDRARASNYAPSLILHL